ncbi:MAG: sulfotransferase [Bacteroidota bacterium]
MASFRTWLNMATEPPASPFRAPIFIIGCMRSGTTFLVDKLTQHPQLLKVGSELREVWTDIGGAPCGGAIGAYRGPGDAQPQYAANMAAYFTRFIEESRNMRRHLMRAKQKWKQGSSSIFYDWDQIFPVNKSTHLVNKIQYLHQLFPTARFLFLIRSIEGQVASLKVHASQHFDVSELLLYAPEDSKASWGQGTRSLFPKEVATDRFFPENFSLLPEMWIRLNGLALQELEGIPKDVYRVIDYEDLNRNQASILQQVFDFLPLDPQHQAAAKKIAAAPMKVINTTVKGNPLDKWKRTLTESEISLVEAYIQSHTHREIRDWVDRIKVRPNE